MCVLCLLEYKNNDNMALYFECRNNKYALLQTAFSTILPTGIDINRFYYQRQLNRGNIKYLLLVELLQALEAQMMAHTCQLSFRQCLEGLRSRATTQTQNHSR